MTYHINPDTGRPNLCRASIRECRYGTTDHFDTKQDAQRYSETRLTEEFGSVSTLKKVSENSTQPKTVEELKKELGVLPETKLYPLIKKRLKLSMTTKEIDKLLEKSGGYDTVSFYAYYTTNQDVSLDYNHHDTVKTFTKGACAMLASELNRVTNLPLVVFSAETDKSSSWSGHVAVKLPNGEYLDIMGPSSRGEILNEFPGGKSWSEEEMNREDFNELMGVDKGTKATDKLESLEKAVLAKICLDLIKDYKLNDPEKAGEVISSMALENLQHLKYSW